MNKLKDIWHNTHPEVHILTALFALIMLLILVPFLVVSLTDDNRLNKELVDTQPKIVIHECHPVKNKQLISKYFINNGKVQAFVYAVPCHSA